MDPVTKAVSSTVAVPFPPLTTYGTNQIVDVLNALDSSHPFKVLHTTIPFVRDAPNGVAAWPLGSSVSHTKNWQNFIQSEYDRFMLTTGLTPKSIMDNPKTNGIYGECMIFYGDWHFGSTFKHKAGAENFVAVSLNALNAGSGNLGTVIGNGSAFELDNMEYLGGAAKRGFDSTNRLDTSGAVASVVEVYGSRQPKEMIVRLYDIAKTTEAHHWSSLVGVDLTPFMDSISNYGTVLDSEGNEWRCTFERKFVQWTDNAGHAAAATPLVFPTIGMRSFG
jgi:hypothetical protein